MKYLLALALALAACEKDRSSVCLYPQCAGRGDAGGADANDDARDAGMDASDGGVD